MYDHICGELASKSPAQAVILAGGVGYRMAIPISTFDALPDQGQARLLTYLHVTDEALRLYGFATEPERRLFLQLISVNGVGPTTALTILNGISVDEFRRSVAAEQTETLCRVKGIGRKTAERIIVELKRDMERELLSETGAPAAAASSMTGDAVSAMLALGYNRSSAEKAVAAALKRIGRDAPLEQVIRDALQQM